MPIYRPPFIKQLDGSLYAGLNCTMAAGAMAAVRERRGRNPAGDAPWYPRPAWLRAKTGDTKGGTRLGQLDSVLYQNYRINLDVEYDLPFPHFRERIESGRGAVLQGGYAPIRGTSFAGSKTFHDNHAVYVNELRWNDRHNRWEYLWYDPLCDGRYHYGRYVPRGPQWLPEPLIQSFTNSLITIGSRRIQRGRVYAAFTRDTEPVITKNSGLIHHRTLWANRRVYVRRAPKARADVVKIISTGSVFRAAQTTIKGDAVGGSTRWWGDINGVEWVPDAHMRRTRT